MTIPDESRDLQNRPDTASIAVSGTIPGGPGTWLAQALITGLCVVAAIVAGVIVAPRSLTPKPLDDVAPATSAEIRASLDTVSSSLDSAGQAVSHALGTSPAPDNDTTAPADQAGTSSGLAAISGQTAAAGDQTPAANDQTAAPSNQTPAVGDQTPATSGETPPATDQTTAPSNPTQAPTDQTPAPTNQTPATTDATTDTPADSDTQDPSTLIDNTVPTETTPTDGQQAYSSTWLTADTIAVTAVSQDQDTCRAMVDSALALLDPAQTKVGMSDQTNTSTKPAIVSLGTATAMPGSLNQCADQLDKAVSNMNAALEAAKNAAAEQAATQQNQLARSDLQTMITLSQRSTSNATGKAIDESLLTTLSTQVDSATSMLATTVPTSGWKSTDDQLSQILAATNALAAAATAVDTAVAAIHVYTGKNGDLDPATLCPVPYDPKQLLRCDAEAAWMKLDAVYKQVWGEDIPIDLSYRTYDEQVQMKAIYGAGAATPGYSNHGWGIAVDLPDYRETEQGKQWNYGEPKYEWMKANGPKYGWSNPAWAVEGGSGPHEPWHFEYHK
ncbi:MAG: D-alanyl-D-alanine carboxypeptidase family protein [Propionibacteriaceae bacterium]|nr:D-alanyl-D-alanine carboxypeptidase family protein [Propionibacteriaceae bacterium]